MSHRARHIALTLSMHMSEHEHVWKPVAHFDGCHYFGWRYSCECGYVKETSQERDVSYDPWSAVWMDPEGREPCLRCEALMAGAPLNPPLEITKPAGAVSLPEKES